MIKKVITSLTSIMLMTWFIMGTHNFVDATTASYNFTMRWVNATGFVINGVASATTANYNYTAQVVDQSGNVLNPGVASSTSATPNVTIRVVDANGFVQSGFNTPAPTASPTASPGPPVFQAAASAKGTEGITLPSASQTPGNLTVIFVATTAAPTAWSSNFNALPVNGWSGGSDSQMYYGCAQSIPTTFSITGGSSTATSICVAVYSGTSCRMDASQQTSTNSASPISLPGITTVTANDVLIRAFGDANTLTNAPSSVTQRALVGGVNGTNFGCYIGDATQAVPSAVPSDASGTLAGNNWGGHTIVFNPKGT